nr:hypothetical protein [Muribaculaceae bacterium]
PPAAGATAHEGRKTVRGRRTERKSADSAATTADAGQYERQRQPVSQEQFTAAWREYIGQNPEKHLLISAMRKEPVAIDAETYKVVVDHPAQREEFKLSMNHLMEFLRSTLRNDYLALEIEVDDSETEKGISPQELLQEIVDQNPVLRQLITDIDGEMG